jgi:hypothetical protein
MIGGMTCERRKHHAWKACMSSGASWPLAAAPIGIPLTKIGGHGSARGRVMNPLRFIINSSAHDDHAGSKFIFSG